MKGGFALLAILLLASGCESGGGSPAGPGPAPPAHDPVLFVHGWGAAPGSWSVMIARFRGEGWSERELHTLAYGPGESNAAVAATIADRVAMVLSETGARRVDIVAHSMGSLASRHYLKFLSGDSRVDAWVSLGGPNHGTRIAILCGAAPCLEMRPESPFLAALNADDETPGITRYATWWSPCDEALDPKETAPLAGAQNTRTACLGHSAFLTDSTIFQQVRRWIAP